MGNKNKGKGQPQPTPTDDPSKNNTTKTTTVPEKTSDVKTVNLKIFIIGMLSRLCATKSNFVGDFGVGKTSLAIKFTRDKFDEEMCKTTNHVPHADLDPMQGGKKINFPINDSLNANIIHFDTAGNEKYAFYAYRF